MTIRHSVKFLLSGVLAVSLGNAAGAGRTQAQSDPTATATLTGPRESSPEKHKEVPTIVAPASESGGNIYRIGTEDELQITVWHEPELSTVVVVRPDGKITVPLLNDVAVVGLKPGELQEVLAVKLKPFINEPQVTVIPRNIRSRKVHLVGQVSHQGSFPINGSLTVLELIADAGGLTPFAKKGSIYVLRIENGQKRRIPFDYKKALTGKKEDVNLLPGDVVVVP